MGTANTRAKNKYNAKNYERIHLIVKKGMKEIYQEQAKSKGMSLNGYINYLLEKDKNQNEQEQGA